MGLAYPGRAVHFDRREQSTKGGAGLGLKVMSNLLLRKAVEEGGWCSEILIGLYSS